MKKNTFVHQLKNNLQTIISHLELSSMSHQKRELRPGIDYSLSKIKILSQVLTGISENGEVNLNEAIEKYLCRESFKVNIHNEIPKEKVTSTFALKLICAFQESQQFIKNVLCDDSPEVDFNVFKEEELTSFRFQFRLKEGIDINNLKEENCFSLYLLNLICSEYNSQYILSIENQMVMLMIPLKFVST